MKPFISLGFMKQTSALRHIIKRAVVGALLATGIVFLTACQSTIFSDPNAPAIENASIQSLVTGTEGSMRTAYNFYIYGVSSQGREAYSLDGSDPRWLTEFIAGGLDPAGPFVGNIWQARYRAMRNAQNVLDRAATLSGAERARLEGFAQTVYAYQLMMLYDVYFENGVKLTLSDDINQPFSDPAATLTEIVRRLDLGNTALGQAGTTFLDPANPNNGFVLSSGFSGLNTPATFARFNRALRARVASYQGDNQGILTALGSSFLRADTTSMALGAYMPFGTGPGDFVNPIFELPTAGVIRFWVQRDFVRDNPDSLIDRRVLNDMSAFGARSYSLGGYSGFRFSTLYKSATDPAPIIRNEELILLRAEANIGLNQIDAARADLNLVRRAAGVAPYTTTNFTATNALDRLLFERKYSLFGEGRRWVDMRRYNRLNSLPNDQTGDRIVRAFPRPQNDNPGR